MRVPTHICALNLVDPTKRLALVNSILIILMDVIRLTPVLMLTLLLLVNPCALHLLAQNQSMIVGCMSTQMDVMLTWVALQRVSFKSYLCLYFMIESTGFSRKGSAKVCYDCIAKIHFLCQRIL